MKTALLALALALACLPNLWGQAVGKETIIYRLTDGFPPYQMEAKEVDSKGRYKRYYEVSRVDWDAYALCEKKTSQYTECGTIRHIENGKYADMVDGKPHFFEVSWYYWDESGCLVNYMLDPGGRAVWFRFCPER